jgi:8-oxo-dGTP pyrophosphatase MutT (NUDIX family)
MGSADTRLAVPRLFRDGQPPVKFFRISHLRKLCECEQVAAVCYRINGHGVEFLLVQTRNGRWTFPKGSSEPGLTHAQAAALEAFEEAGVHGRMEEASFSRYFRRRGEGKKREKRIKVNAHLCEVSRQETPVERKRKPTWFTPDEAKQRLREDRPPDYGADLCRVIAHALVRIQKSRDTIGTPNERVRFDAQLDRRRLELKKDALQEVQFTVVDNLGSTTNRSIDPADCIENPGFTTRPMLRLLRARSQ